MSNRKNIQIITDSTVDMANTLKDRVKTVPLTVSFEDSKFPSMEYLRENEADIIEHLRKDAYIQYYELLENDEKVLCYFGKDNKPYIGVYDKKEGSGYYTSVESIVDDLGVLKFIRPKTVYNGYFVSPVYVENLEAMTEESIIYPLVKNESDGGNPIILLYK